MKLNQKLLANFLLACLKLKDKIMAAELFRCLEINSNNAEVAWTYFGAFFYLKIVADFIVIKNKLRAKLKTTRPINGTIIGYFNIKIDVLFG
jgi:hypothetical protein